MYVWYVWEQWVNCRYAAALIVAMFVAELYLRPRGYNWRERTRGSTYTDTHARTSPLGGVLKDERTALTSFKPAYVDHATGRIMKRPVGHGDASRCIGRSIPPRSCGPGRRAVPRDCAMKSCRVVLVLLVSAPGVDACVHTHGASMKLVDGFPVMQEGSDTAPTARSAAMVCCIREGMGIWVRLGAGVSGCTCGPATFRALCVYVNVTCVSVRCPLWQSVLVALPRCLQPAPYHGSWSFNVSIVTDILASLTPGLCLFRNCNDDVTQQICRDLRSAKRAACVSSDFLEFAGCRSAKSARSCVRESLSFK